MAKGKLIIVGVIVLLVGAFVLLPSFLSFLYPSQGLSITFYDADGKAISDTYAFQTPSNDIVVSFQPTVWWKVTGTNVDLSTLSVDGTLLIQTLSIYDRWNTLQTVTFTHGNEGAADDSHVCAVYEFATLLSSYMDTDYKASGWTIKVTVTLTFDMKDTEGNQLATQTKDFATQFSLTWYEGTFSVEGGVTYTQA